MTVRLGTAYYNEYLPDPGRLETDLRLMAEAGIGCIRVGESVWSTWEPADGRFDLEWLTPVLDGAAAHGIDAILGTPTYAVPPWLSRKHPELAVRRRDGSRVPWGARQEADFTADTFRAYAERVIRAVVGRHGRHPAVVGIQLDNEPGLHLIHNEGVVARFRRWVADRYGDPETLNHEWGLAYWSHRIADWDELWEPAGNTTPAYELAWRRFQAEQTTEFIAWQAGIVRELVADDTFLTTCIAYQRPAMDDVAVGAALDVASGNAYYLAQDALALATDGAGGHWYADDVPQVVLMADRVRATKEAPFLVTETGAGSIGPARLTRPPYDGQLGQAAWLLAARGARLVSYWHWHTLHSGAEAHWGGILGHDLEPGRVYDQVAATGRQLAAAAPWLADARPDEQVGVVHDHDSEWLTAFDPPFGTEGAPDRASYQKIVGAFGRGAVDAGLQVGYLNARRLPPAGELVRRYPTLVVAGLIAAPDATLAILAEYARLGGRLVLGPRTGYGDHEGRMRPTRAPALLGDAAGVTYRETAALADPVEVRLGDLAGTAHGWADCLEPDGATTLARYDHPHLGRWAAATRRAVGQGEITVVGTMLDRRLLARVMADAAGPAVPAWPVVERPEAVTLHSLVGARGRVWVLHNWSAVACEVVTARGVDDVLAGSFLDDGERVVLGAWGVAVWGEPVLDPAA
ncbi:beta-galactosidase [Promicromonospora sp. NPDC057488]|uniref:beta-galactosidase n=1 Tax=Promicromonospora sp. NPDC057488 TaxID=3346147 RepID=UPI0036704B10